MFRNLISLLTVIFLAANTAAQKRDSLFFKVRPDTLMHSLYVEQDFYLINRSAETLKEVYLNAKVNAYTGRDTELNRVKLENRKGALYFSTTEERGKVLEAEITDSAGNLLEYEYEKREFIRVKLKNEWKPGTALRLKADYSVKLPFDAVTRYGYNEKGEYLLKYFFLMPAIIEKDGSWDLRRYKDFEEAVILPSYLDVDFELPEGYHMYSDLSFDGKTWNGITDHFRIFLTPDETAVHSFYDPGTKLWVDLAFEDKASDFEVMDSLLPSQLAFLNQYLGKFPQKRLLITSKTESEQNYTGLDDLEIGIKTYRLFTPKQRQALRLFQMLSYEYQQQIISLDHEEDHWIENGLHYYLIMKYADANFPDLKLTGELSENVKIFGMKPLKLFHASRIEMNERYKLAYLYLARQNFDQPIDTPFHALSRLNQTVISGFKTGLTFYYIASYMGNDTFNDLIREFFEENRNRRTGRKEFRKFLEENSSEDLSWFFDDFIGSKEKINFRLLKSEETQDSLKLRVENPKGFRGPFLAAAYKGDSIVKERWYTVPAKKSWVNFPKGDYDKIVLNPGYLFPEYNDRDNYMMTSGFFKNRKKLQFKLYSDMENTEYSQIFMNPRLGWNNYDKFMLGIQFHNRPLLPKAFRWGITPTFSTGTGSLTGNAKIEQVILPHNFVFRSLLFGSTVFYEHYDYRLSYVKLAFYSMMEFRKEPRASLSHGFLLSYDHLNKELPHGMIKTDEDKYGLWNLSYYYSRPNYIHESHGSVTLQSSHTFQKIFGEIYYRWRFSPKKQLGIRFFAGTFFYNGLDTDYFNFGISHVSDYAFNLAVLGRSETSGILSRQYFLAESGFKSLFEETANRWTTALNLELPVWKMFDLYSDVGVYKNKGSASKFIYDSGVKIKIIPDFLEIYLPVQSSLGFEPSKGNYWDRIRFTLNLDLQVIVNHLRRGWY